MRLSRSYQVAFYTSFGALFLSGIAWLIAHEIAESQMRLSNSSQEIATVMLAIHGGSAMLTLVMIGMLISVHIQASWRLSKNRFSGSLMCTTAALLVLTSFLLYYSGSDSIRDIASDVHIALGIALPVLLAFHIWLGRRSRANGCVNSQLDVGEL